MIHIWAVFKEIKVWINRNKSFIKIKIWQVGEIYYTQLTSLHLIKILNQKIIIDFKMN
jgi:hypothetical protein